MDMNMMQRFVDARHCLEGKAVAVTLALLMALSFLNVPLLVQTAYADNGDTVFDEGTLNDNALPNGDDGVQVSQNGTNESHDFRVIDEVQTELEDSQENGVVDKTSSPVVFTKTVEDTAITVEIDASGIPEEMVLEAEFARTDSAVAAVEAALHDQELHGKVGAVYQLAMKGKEGEALDLGEISYRVTITLNAPLAGGLCVYALTGADAALPVGSDSSLTPDGTVSFNSVSFETSTLGAPFALVTLENEEQDGDAVEEPEPNDEMPSNEESFEGTYDSNDVLEELRGEAGQEVVSDPTVPENGGDDESGNVSDADAQQIVLYVGEERNLSSLVDMSQNWSTENSSVATVASNGTVKALAVGETIVRCNGDEAFRVVVRECNPDANEEEPALAYFYFLPPSEGNESGAESDTAKAQFIGSGLVKMPYGYKAGMSLVDGTVLPEGKDSNGEIVRDKVIMLDNLIVETPSDREVRYGLEAYYDGSLDEGHSKIKASDITGYSYNVVRIDGQAVCEGYNGAALVPASAIRVYVQMNVTTADRFTVSYKVQGPSGQNTRSVLHNITDDSIELARGVDGDKAPSTLVVDGATYPGAQHVASLDGESSIDYYFDGWYEDSAYRVRASEVYAGKESTTFYARYLSRSPLSATFSANGGNFSDGNATNKTVQADTGSVYWMIEAPTRFGYQFKGWAVEGTNSVFPVGFGRMMGDSSINYVAVWEPLAATITLDAAGGMFEGHREQMKLDGVTGQAVELDEVEIPSKPGYRFLGWNTKVDGTGESLSSVPGSYAAGNMTIYAQYEEDPTQYYTVTYRSTLGGRVSQSESVVSGSFELYDKHLYYGSTDGIKGALATAIPGDYYTFLGWCVVDDSVGEGIRWITGREDKYRELSLEDVAVNLNKDANGNFVDTVFEARFAYSGVVQTETVNYRIDYYYMGDDGAYPAEGNPTTTRPCEIPAMPDTRIDVLADKYYDIDLRSPEYREKVSADFDLARYDRQDYVIDLNAAGSRLSFNYDPTDRSMPVLNVYMQKYLKVSFNAGEEGFFGDAEHSAMMEYRCLKGDAMPMPPAIVPRDGYKFAGWLFEGTDASELLNQSVERATTFTASYDALEATIQFDTQGGSTVEPLQGVTDQAIDQPLPVTTKEGYTFVGWFDGDEKVDALPAKFPAGTTIYEARWSANDAYIVFDKNASDATGSQEGLQGKTDAEVPAVDFPQDTSFKREGYRFVEWNTQPGGSGEKVEAYPTVFAPGKTTYYAIWELDTHGLTSTDFSAVRTYDGRFHGIATPSSLKLRQGEKIQVWTSDGRLVSDPYGFVKNVSDSVSDLVVVIVDARGKEVGRVEGVSVVFTPATLTVVTSSAVRPLEGGVAVSSGITVTGLVNGETIGYRTTGQATAVGQEVPNTYELIWAASDNNYTAQRDNYTVVEELGTIRAVTPACPVSIEGYVGEYDGLEHAITYELGDKNAAITFDGPTRYTDAGDYTVSYTVQCPDHGTITGSVEVRILPRRITILVEDAYKVFSTQDPQFSGSIIEGSLVRDTDLGLISFVRTNTAEAVGIYPDVLTATYLRNRNYVVDVIKGTFAIGAGATSVVPGEDPIIPPDGGDSLEPAPARSSLGAGMPQDGAAVQLAAAVVNTIAGTQRAEETVERFEQAASIASIALDNEPAGTVSVAFDDAQPVVTRVGGEEIIEDDATALGAFDEPRCWAHWAMVLGIVLTMLYAIAVVAHRLGYARKIEDIDAGLTGDISTEESHAAHAAHLA